MEIEGQLCKDNYGFWVNGSHNHAGVKDFCFQKKKMQRACFDVKNGQSFAFVNAQVEEQKREVDRLISYQNERLRLAVQEQKRQQIESILRNYEAKMAIIMKQKDQELAEALNKKLELEGFLIKMEIECQKWQQVATEYETMMVTLNDTIEQNKQNAYFTTQVEDSESCCDIEAEENNVNIGHKRSENICKCCGFQISRVILFPCRHLCCCKSCDGFLGNCPICGVAKKASIEALF